MASPPYILLFLLLSILCHTLSTCSSTPNTITLPLSPILTKPKSSHPLHTLKLAASASLTRAHHLKLRNKNNPSPPSVTTTPVYQKFYGAYSIDLSIGTPPQTTSFVLDTGSSLVWFPCTSHYICSHCNFPTTDQTTQITTFIPQNSTTAKVVSCTNPKCSYIHDPNFQSRCPKCKPQSQSCTQTCPSYFQQYGSGFTAGFLLLDNLNFSRKIVPQFLVGCSTHSYNIPSGLAGFGRTKESLPSQMNLNRFSYCLIPQSFDGTPENSDLVLQISSTGNTKTKGLSYTPLRPNPSTNDSVFAEYYYLTLRKIIVGREIVNIPFEFLEPDSEGNGGTIVDSGTTLTFMERPIYEFVAQEFIKQVQNYPRVEDAEAQSGLSPCFDISGVDTVTFPKLTFRFKGGAQMILPPVNYFSLVDDGVVCLTVFSDDGGSGSGSGSDKSVGPAIILGNYMQRNFYVEYDLENQRFGFGPRNCKRNL